MRVLYVKSSLAWPRTSGHDVYCYYMMKGMANLGADVSLATNTPVDPRAVEGVRLAYCAPLAAAGPAGPAKMTRLQERYRSFWGVTHEQIAAVTNAVSATNADVVIAFGLNALPYLAGVARAVRVWAMADEWVYHHLSLLRPTDRSTWHHLRTAIVKGVYERAYSSLVDRAWAVSDTDQRAGRWLAGIRHVDLLPNGVDTDFYAPIDTNVMPETAVFWGRLDFEPNVDALVWFFDRVWPDVLREVPRARFSIIGYQPTEIVARLATRPGVSLSANVDDLRLPVSQHALVALPMVSGGGIKNKLLEGAAMGRAIVCTPRAAMDLRSRGQLPVVKAERPADFAREMISLWRDDGRRQTLGREARAWVQEFYSWGTPARNALIAFQESIDARRSA